MKLGFLRASTAGMAFGAVFATAAPAAHAQDFGRIIERGVDRAVTRGVDAIARDWTAERAQERREEDREHRFGVTEAAKDNQFQRTQAARDADLRRRLQLDAARFGMRSQYDQNRAALRDEVFTPRYNDDFSRFAGGGQTQSYPGAVYQGPASAAPAFRVVREDEACRTGERRVRIIPAGGEESPACMPG